MEAAPEPPWSIRDHMLREMGWTEPSRSWAARKAAAINQVFKQQGATGQPGRITAETVEHGEQRGK
jgi:hypothetical protein